MPLLRSKVLSNVEISQRLNLKMKHTLDQKKAGEKLNLQRGTVQIAIV